MASEFLLEPGVSGFSLGGFMPTTVLPGYGMPRSSITDGPFTDPQAPQAGNVGSVPLNIGKSNPERYDSSHASVSLLINNSKGI